MTHLVLREASLDDLDFLIKIDLDDEGISTSQGNRSESELADHRAKIASFVGRKNDWAWIIEDTHSGALLAVIMCRFRDRTRLDPTVYDSLRIVGDNWLQPETRYCEVFQLWVDPGYRRQGLATRLKRHIEAEADSRGVRFIYTHTEEQNSHVIELNLKLGYRKIRRGPIWDSVTRVSLVKRLA